MQQPKYDIGQLFNLAFGITPSVVFNIPGPPSYRDVEKWIGINGFKPDFKEEVSTVTKQSWLGTPIMFPMKLKGGNNMIRYKPTGQTETVKYADFDMPATTLVDFSRAKNIAKTELLGGSGTVKEMFGFDDWKIRIRGLCLDEPGIRTADQQREALYFFEQLAESIFVSGYVFDKLQIDKIVINSLTFRQVEGKPWVLPFEIEAESDVPLEIESL